MDHIIWNVKPYIFKIGSFAPRWYGLMFSVGFILGFFYVKWIYKKEGKDPQDVLKLLLYIVIGTLVGARLGHCLFYEPAYYLFHPLDILKIWKGGLASHGGGLGVIIAVLLYLRKRPDQSFIWLGDIMAAPLALTGCFIRLGNFFNSEIIGKPSTLPWAMIFSKVDSVPRHPAQLYEAFVYLALSIILVILYNKKGKQLRPGMFLGIMFIWIFTSRIFIELVKENQVSFEDSMFANMGQILSVPFIIFGILLVTGLYNNIVNYFFPKQYFEDE